MRDPFAALRQPRSNEDVIRRMSNNINAGEYINAVWQGDHHLDNLRRAEQGPPRVTDFWFHYGLACLLSGDDSKFRFAHETAQGCSDFTPLKDGDFKRDIALHHIRQRNFEEAEQQLAEVKELHRQDDNRMAAAKMVEGRLAYAKRNFVYAEECFTDADNAWKKCQVMGMPVDEQWRRNNRFYRMLAYGHRDLPHPAREQARDVLSDEGESKNSRRRAAKLIMLFPTFGAKLIDRLKH